MLKEIKRKKSVKRSEFASPNGKTCDIILKTQLIRAS